MACIKVPVPTIPELPAPISLTPPIDFPIPDFAFGLCCKLPIPPIPLPPINIPALTVNPAFIATLNGYIKQLNDYLNSLEAGCPLEGLEDA